jgi:4-hydroxybenzoyl-CoA thioesterase
VRFATEQRVRFGHSDPAGIAYYPRYFEWFHDAFEAFFEYATGRSYAELIQSHRVGYPAVQVACEWRGPAAWGERVRVEVFPSRLGERSAVFELRVRKEDRLVATARLKIATLGMDDHRPAPMPPEVQAALQRFVEADDGEGPQLERLA